MRKIRLNWKTLVVYLLGHIVLAFGVCLNTKTMLGVSPVVSVAYNISLIWRVPIGQSTFVYYLILIGIQFLLLWRRFDRFQVFQVLAGFLGSFFLQIFDGLVSVPNQLMWRLLALGGGVLLTGIGASLTVAMKILPNPADALAHTIGTVCHKNFGFGKNILDLICISISLSIGFLFTGGLLGIGLGTLVAVFMTGRVIACVHPWSERLYNRLNVQKT